VTGRAARPNGGETVEQIAGLAIAGFVRAGLYAHQAGEVNAYLLGLVGARALIVEARQLDQLQPHLAGIETLEHVIVYGDKDAHGLLSYEQLLGGAAATDPAVELAPDDVHVIRSRRVRRGDPRASTTPSRDGWRSATSTAG